MPFPTCASRLKHGLASVVATEESLLNERLAAAFQWHTDDIGYMQDLSGIYADAGLIAELGPALASLHGPGPTVVVDPGTQGWVLGPRRGPSRGNVPAPDPAGLPAPQSRPERSPATPLRQRSGSSRR